MTELLEAIMSARDRVLMLLILTIAVLLVTYIIYTISGRTGFIKYLPGLLLTGAGVYYLYRGLQQITTKAGLNELMSAMMFIVIGLVGVCFALILGIYHQGEGQKTKRRAQALDYLQEARSTEAVVYPDRKEAVAAVEANSAAGLTEAERIRLTEEQKAKEEQRLLAEEERRQQKEQELAAQNEQKEALRAQKEAQDKKRREEHETLLQKEEHRFLSEKESLLTQDAQRREEAKLQLLEKDLVRKNAIRDDVLAYNARAQEVNDKDDAGFMDRLQLFGKRLLIQLKKWHAAFAMQTGTGMAKVSAGIQKGTGLLALHTGHSYRRLMTRFEANKNVQTETKEKEKAADPKDKEPTA